MNFLPLLFCLTLSALASELELVDANSPDLRKRPPAFPTETGLAVFTDMTQASYQITYDLIAQKASVEAQISFLTAEEGMPVFDSLAEPTAIELDGQAVEASLIATPDKKTLLRVVNRSIPAGSHTLSIKLPLEQMVEFSAEGVRSAFWMGDLEDRNYIEKYLPTNFIYDRIPMTLRLKFKGGMDNQRIYTNGTVTRIAENDYRVSFQKNLNNTCPYFHTAPRGSFLERNFSYVSKDGRKLPAVIYISPETPSPEAHLTHLQTLTTTILTELESDYGSFPHQSLTIYNNGPKGGMEYAGATITSEGALGHELFHSYFARGVMPANGNAGWIDEALARWRDNGYQRLESLSGSSYMANLGTYSRLTDRGAYRFGERFMALVDSKVADKGGLKPFLTHLVDKKSFDPMTTEDFISELNSFYGVNLTLLFKKYVYGMNFDQMKKKNHSFETEPHPHHHQFSNAELRDLL